MQKSRRRPTIQSKVVYDRHDDPPPPTPPRIVCTMALHVPNLKRKDSKTSDHTSLHSCVSDMGRHVKTSRYHRLQWRINMKWFGVC